MDKDIEILNDFLGFNTWKYINLDYWEGSEMKPEQNLKQAIKKLINYSKKYKNMYESEHRINLTRNEQVARYERQINKAKELEKINKDYDLIMQRQYEHIEKQQRELKIVDEYVSLLWGILCDYDGYYDPETKQGSLEGLAGLVDEAMNICDKIRDRDITSIIYEDCNDNKYNILHEKIEKISSE